MRKVLIAPEVFRDKPGPHIETLQAAGFTVGHPNRRGLARGLCTAAETIDELSSYSAVLAGGELYSREVLRGLPGLRVIARIGVGYDRVDVAAATAQRIAVTITPTANHEGVAEHALALIFAVAKGIVRNDRLTRQGQWPQTQAEPIRGKTLGLLGLGRIGKSLAIRALALGMNVLAFDKAAVAEFAARHAIKLVSLDELLAQSDYLSLHCPLNDETRCLMNARAFACMKPGSFLINTARGGLVDEADLLAALKSGRLAGAGLDVFQQEPAAADNPLFQLDNIVVAPHLAGSDKLSLARMVEEAASCVAELSAGRWPSEAGVNGELRAGWRW